MREEENIEADMYLKDLNETKYLEDSVWYKHKF
jgi:hypothetical protein